MRPVFGPRDRGAISPREDQSVNNASQDATPLEGNRFAPPVAHVEDVTESAAGQLADRGSRFGAALIDMVIGLAAITGLSLATGWKFWSPPTSQPLLATFLVNLGIGFVAYVLVHGWLLHTRGQTVGKMLLKMRIVRTDGSRVGIVRLLLLRYLLNTLFCIVPLVGGLYALIDGLMIFRKSHKCVHDNLADTLVVKV